MSGGVTLENIIEGQLLLQGNTYLWFLPTLFCIFAVAWFLEHLSLPEILKICLLFVLHFSGRYVKIALVGYLFQYLLWFYMGYYFEHFRERINNAICMKRSLAQMIICAGVYLIYRILSKQQELLAVLLTGIVRIGLIISLCYLVYQFCYLASVKGIACSSVWYQLILRNSMGIYLYSDPLNYAVMFFLVKTLGGFIFTNPFGVIVMVLTRFAVTLSVSIILTEVLRKCHLKYLC